MLAPHATSCQACMRGLEMRTWLWSPAADALLPAGVFAQAPTPAVPPSFIALTQPLCARIHAPLQAPLCQPSLTCLRLPGCLLTHAYLHGPSARHNHKTRWT